VAFKFAVVSQNGDVFETFEASRFDWKVGDPVILAGNRRFRVAATIPVERMSEFIEGSVYGVLEVEPA
jgi:hypothetical protein